MKTSQHKLFSPSGCLTQEALKLLEQGNLSAEEKQKALQHIRTCELCSLAVEGLSNVDFTQMTTDLEEVKRHLKVVRPLDFMHENRGIRFKLRIRIITILIIIALAFITYLLTTTKEEPAVGTTFTETEVPFRLMRKDTTSGRLEYKTPNKKAKWEAKLKKQHEEHFN